MKAQTHFDELPVGTRFARGKHVLLKLESLRELGRLSLAADPDSGKVFAFDPAEAVEPIMAEAATWEGSVRSTN